MSDRDEGLCPGHSGLEEKNRSVFGRLALVIWLLAMLIAVVVGSAAFQFSSLNALTRETAAMKERLIVMQEASKELKAKISDLELADIKFKARLDDLERRLK